MKTTKSMIEYIATCSKMSLESFLLARLNDRANYRKQMIEIVDELIENDVQARVAEWILVQRRNQEQLQAGAQQLRRPPLNASRPEALKGAGNSLPRLRAAAQTEGTAPADMTANPVVSLLRDAVPNARPHASSSSATAANAPGAQASGAGAGEHCAVASKSKRIA